MLESWKFAGPCKSVVTEDGIELSYCELGEEHDEIVVNAGFYFHTWYPVMEELAKKYHVYGLIVRYGDGEGTQFNEDGSIHWAKQWADDLYKFAKALGIEKFHYVGKCHGTVPGWGMVKNHPEMIRSFCSFYLAPHVLPQNADEWHSKRSFEEGVLRTQRGGMDGVARKKAEIAALSGGPEDYGTNPPEWKYVIGCELFWDTTEECLEFVKNMTTPICYMFGTDDILFEDWYDSNMKMIFTTNRGRTVILQGERHLMCMDCPDRVAAEASIFIEESKKHYN